MRTVVTAALLFAVILLATASLTHPAHAQANAGHPSEAATAAAGLKAELGAIRAATEKYADVNAALADGYIRDPSNMCITSAMEGAPRQLGAMGVHYLRPDLLGLTGNAPRVNGQGTHTDFHKPAVLMYEPQADGSQRLVGIENLVWAQAWHDAGHDSAPSFYGNDYFYMHDNPATEADEAHGFEPHYELHFWLYQENPTGMFTPFNPAVTCEHH